MYMALDNSQTLQPSTTWMHAIHIVSSMLTTKYYLRRTGSKWVAKGIEVNIKHWAITNTLSIGVHVSEKRPMLAQRLVH